MSRRERFGKTGAGMTRRAFARLCAASVPAVATFLNGCASLFERGDDAHEAPELACADADTERATYDYIVVGSGAGGGPLAARLAAAGHRVLLLEAGGDAEPYNYQVPAYHTMASEDERLRWDFFVRHYADDGQSRNDPKFVEARDGVLYPRAGTLGGCTAHHAMITVCAHNSDWDEIAALTGDESWHSDNMRKYFERLERCRYRGRPSDAQSNPARHGFDGWLTTDVADWKLLLKDAPLKKMSLAVVDQVLDDATADMGFFGSLWERLRRSWNKLSKKLDPNDWRLVKRSAEGVCMVPLSVKDGRRVGTREYIEQVRRACPRHLVVQTHSLVTKVLLDDEQRAVGVRYQRGENLYRAERSPSSASTPAIELEALATREVIVSGGAFNTPQLLMLSGIGPPEELARHGIDVRVPLPGVGRNLQDRYEVGVLVDMKGPIELLKGATFREPGAGAESDPHFREWLEGEGVYTTNGAVAAVITRSSVAGAEPDLFIFGLAGYFKGYFPDYSDAIREHDDVFTWAVLKAHTNNAGGRVRLRSADPREPPDVNFHYFEEGTDESGADLEAVVDGIEYVRRLNERAGNVIRGERLPGPDVETREQLRRFVRDNAWGHHASCTCKMGPSDDAMAVVDHRFRVHGTRGLRIVDASIFPRIPGFFIVTPIYMASEKASDVILEDARREA